VLKSLKLVSNIFLGVIELYEVVLAWIFGPRKFQKYDPNPTQPNPWVNPTHVHVCAPYFPKYRGTPWIVSPTLWRVEMKVVATTLSDVKAKIHPIRFLLGLRPRPDWGSLQRSPRPLAGFKWTCFQGHAEKGGKGEWIGTRRRGLSRASLRSPVPFTADLRPCSVNVRRWSFSGRCCPTVEQCRITSRRHRQYLFSWNI